MTKIFKIPFATQGDRTAVPDEVQADGSLSYTQGYGYDYERDQATDPAAKDIEREKMNSLFHDITGAVGEIQAFGMPVWAEEGKPYAIRSVVYHNKKAWQSKIENNKTEPAAGTAWTELKADMTAGDVGAYTKGEADQKFQPLGNYLPAGYSYSKAESDTNFQPKGNYAPAGNYAMKGDSYTKAEGDGRYQAKGNYAPAGDYAAKGESYTKSESDNKYQPKGSYQTSGYSYSKAESDGRYEKKGAAKGWRKVGGAGNASSSISMSEDVRGKQLYFQLTGSGGIHWTTVCMPPVDNIGTQFHQGNTGYGIVCTQNAGRTLKSVGGQFMEWSSVYVAD